MSLKLNHRHPTYTAENTDFESLYNDSRMMIDRAKAVLDVLQATFVDYDDGELLPIKNSTIFINLCIIENELNDTEELLKHYQENGHKKTLRRLQT